MSIRVMTLVWDGYPGNGSGLLALLALADWADDCGNCWPSIASISKRVRLSRSQAQRVVHSLIEEGIVVLTGNIMGGAPGATRQYRINLEALRGSTDATGSANATGRTDALDGSHGCGETGSTHATQTVNRTVIEPSVNKPPTARTRKTKRPVPADFQISERVKVWAISKGYDRLDEHLDAFKAKCAAKGYVYADHDAAFMEAVRTDWAKLRGGSNTPTGRRTTSEATMAREACYERPETIHRAEQDRGMRQAW